MKKIILVLFTFFLLIGFTQNEITFQIENLSKPEELLRVSSSDDIYKKLILSDVNMYSYKAEKEQINFPFNIIAKSVAPDSLVNFGYNSFFRGMYQAYANHRPFVLSPDMIWLLITQGFARHVNANSNDLRDLFVDFSGKLSLIVETNKVSLDNPQSPWNEIFPEFTKQISEHVGTELVELLSCDFSTTTSIEKVASEITIMEAMKPYFEFIVIYAVCGIPEITLKGTTEDWERVLEKTKMLSKYNLDWWTTELEPILKEFIRASRGKVNKRFWQNMFKYHTQKKYGAPNIIDGWIVKFFPYDKDGKRNDLRKLIGGNNLPDEIVKVDLKYVELADNGIAIETPLELWAGFIGLEQNETNFALTPQIAWMIRKKDVEKIGLKQKLESDSKFSGGISIRVKEFPKELLSIKETKSITIEFLDRITIPDEFANVKVKFLYLTGKINKREIDRIKNMFPDTQITINEKMIQGQESLMKEILDYR